jgi:DNA-binding response OmpR family regulator
VEDDYLISLLLEERLAAAGFEVVGVATTAEEANEMAAAQKPHLAVMDVRLPGTRDGVDAALDLMKRHQIPSVFATAHADVATRKRAERANPLAWLQKPYSPDELIEVINSMLKPSRPHES